MVHETKESSLQRSRTDSSLAQLAEHGTDDLEVVSSNPTGDNFWRNLFCSVYLKICQIIWQKCVSWKTQLVGNYLTPSDMSPTPKTLDHLIPLIGICIVINMTWFNWYICHGDPSQPGLPVLFSLQPPALSDENPGSWRDWYSLSVGPWVLIHMLE